MSPPLAAWWQQESSCLHRVAGVFEIRQRQHMAALHVALRAGTRAGEHATPRRRRRVATQWRRRQAALVLATVTMVVSGGGIVSVAGERVVAASSTHVCMVQPGGVAACYGMATNSMLVVPSTYTFHGVMVGDTYSCGLTTSGNLACWGAPLSPPPPPRQFFVDAHGGASSVCGLMPNGTVACYGPLSAAAVPAGLFQSVTVGPTYACGVLRTHGIRCWGTLFPSPIPAVTDAEHVACGTGYACYVKVDGSVACWGSISVGQATPPPGLTEVWWLAAGVNMTCALSGAGPPSTLTCWGALSGVLSTAAYEVACTSWGCIVSEVDARSGGVIATLLVADRAVIDPTIATFTYSLLIKRPWITDTIAIGMGTPSGVAVSADRLAVYVADSTNHVIRRASVVDGSATVVAGLVGSFDSSDGTGTIARFHSPGGIDMDANGNLYVADIGNDRVRTVSAAGVVSPLLSVTNLVDLKVFGGTVYAISTGSRNTAGTIQQFPASVPTPPPLAKVAYTAIAVGGIGPTIYCSSATGLVTASAPSTLLYSSTTIAALAAAPTGGVYAADGTRVRSITSTGTTSVIAGSSGSNTCNDGTAATFTTPTSIAVDAAGTIYVGDSGCYGGAIRRLRVSPPAVSITSTAPMPPSPLMPTDQLVAWRTWYAGSSAVPLDARSVTFSSPLSAANTAGMNPRITNLVLGPVELAPRDAAGAAGNATFSTSAQRRLRALTLTAASLPANALNLPALTTLLLSAPAATLQLWPGAFAGLTANLTCINCNGVPGLANLSAIGMVSTIVQPSGLLALPGISLLDLSSNAVGAVGASDFDPAPYLRALLLSGNSLATASCAAFVAAKQPQLVMVNMSGTPLVTSGCPPGSYVIMWVAAACCTPCPAGSRCVGGLAPPAACPARYFCPTSAVTPTSCPAGSFCPPGAISALPCLAGSYCPPESAAPIPCGANSVSEPGAVSCTPCARGTATATPAAGTTCPVCTPATAASSCNATATWGTTLTLIADGAGSWNAVALVNPAVPGIRVPCAPVVAVSPTAATCTVRFLLPDAAATSSPLQLWVSSSGGGFNWQQLAATVTIVSPAVTVVPAGSGSMAPLVAGARITLQLPQSRLTSEDWDAASWALPRPANISGVTVWLGGAPCSSPAWQTLTTVVCTAPALDGAVTAVVEVGGAFNVTGSLPATAFAAPVLTAPQAGTARTLLPPTPATTPTNIVLTGVGLCVGAQPRIASARVGGGACASIVCTTGTQVTCVGWVAPAGVLPPSPTAALNASAVWASVPSMALTCDACVWVALRPVVSAVTPRSVSGAGAMVVVSGAGFSDGAGSAPIVVIGGVHCDSVTVISPEVVSCIAPTPSISAPGYPVVAVSVTNAVGAGSTETGVTLGYPVRFGVAWNTTSPLLALPGAPFTPVPTLAVQARDAATCTITLNATACAPPSDPSLLSRPAAMAVLGTAAVPIPATGTVNASLVLVPTTGLSAGGASGCGGVLVASCIDVNGFADSTAGHPSPSITLPAWQLAWSNADLPAQWVVTPTPLPRLNASFSLLPSAALSAAVAAGAVNLTATPLLTCVAVLVAADAALPSTPLDEMRPHDVLSSVAGVVAGANQTAATVYFGGLTASGARLHQALTVGAECTWTFTGERLRLPLLSLSVIDVHVELAVPSGLPLRVNAFEAAYVTASLSATPASLPAPFASSTGTCHWVGINASVPSLALAPDSLAARWDVLLLGGLTPTLTWLKVAGPPAEAMWVRFECTLWGTFIVAAAPLPVVTADYVVTVVDGTQRRAWPSSALASGLAPWNAPITVTAPAQGVLTCSLDCIASAVPPPGTDAGHGLGLADPTVALVGDVAVSVALPAAATRANATLARVGLRAPGGTVATLAVTCRDGVGRSAVATDVITLNVVALEADWDTASSSAYPTTIVPSQSLPSLVARVASVPAVSFPAALHPAAALSCMAGIYDAAAPLPLSVPLALAPGAAASVSAATVTLDAAAGNATLVVAFQALPTAACPLRAALVVAAECTWSATGERVRLPPMAFTTVDASLAWASPPDVVLGYTATPLPLQATLHAGVAAGAAGATTGDCDLVLLNATSRAASLVADGWEFMLDPSASGGGGGSVVLPAAPHAALHAPPGTTAYLVAVCTAWGKQLSTPPLRVTTATLTLRPVFTLPTAFIASDTTMPWPVEPALVAAVVTVEGSMPVDDVVCALTSATPSAQLFLADETAGATTLLSIPVQPGASTVVVPRFIVQTAYTTSNVTLSLTCRRTASGDAPLPLQFVMEAVQLRAAMCSAPQSMTTVGTSLLPFTVGVGHTTGLGGSSQQLPCVGTPTAVALPPIVCAIALNVTASTSNDTANIFLQQSVAAVDAASHNATFGAFALVAPQGATYGLTLRCTVGGLVIPPLLPFTVSLDGCPAGQQSLSVTCVACGDGSFSFGGTNARCVGCPPSGATCDGGILHLARNYFRPAAQAGQPLGPDTELHPCYNTAACTLAVNGSNVEYGCSPGYSGALCGVCDVAANYAQFGDACAPCWTTGASAFFMAVVLLVVLALLTHVALFGEAYSTYPDDAIVLRIGMSYLQAVGSLRVFTAGSTQAYANVMGWTEVVSASPMSAGALQCISRVPYLTQYIMTVLLPLLAAVTVVVIFCTATFCRSIRPVCRLDVSSATAAVRGWLASKRHLSTFLFVLFLAYMAIVSASLRALDCIRPVAGIRYLRSNLSVECGVGQHAVARALAYVVLVVVGIGFPLSLAWLLGAAPKAQLSEKTFHAAWGFLYDGYRFPRAPSHFSGSVTSTSSLSAGGGTDALVAAGGEGKIKPPRRLDRSHKSTMHMVAALTTAGDSRAWWETVVLIRKAGVVLLAVLVTNPYMQCVGATLWFFGAILLQLKFTPYAQTKFNRLELATLGTNFVTAVLSTALLQFNVDVAAADLHPPDAMTPIEWAVTAFLVLLNLGMLLTLGYLWWRVQWGRVRDLSAKHPGLHAAVLRVDACVAACAPHHLSTHLRTPRRTTPHAHCAAVELPPAAASMTTVNPLRSSAHAAPPPDEWGGGATITGGFGRRRASVLLMAPAAPTAPSTPGGLGVVTLEGLPTAPPAITSSAAARTNAAPVGLRTVSFAATRVARGDARLASHRTVDGAGGASV